MTYKEIREKAITMWKEGQTWFEIDNMLEAYIKIGWINRRQRNQVEKVIDRIAGRY